MLWGLVGELVDSSVVDFSNDAGAGGGEPNGRSRDSDATGDHDSVSSLDSLGGES